MKRRRWRTGRSLLLGLALFSCTPAAEPPQAPLGMEEEVFYHIFVRSFRDSNGDHAGDLHGIQDRLAYLQDLGVTSLLLTPINPSPFYHNYFASSFEGVDPVYGDQQALLELTRALHQRGMKLYLDQEIQYAVGEHRWWKESAGQPGSPYSSYLIYHGPGNTEPEPAVFGITRAGMYNGDTVSLTTVNLLEPKVRDYFAGLFASMVDPNGDGKFEDGVDGFRIDHMMDDLDAKGILPGLFARFWAPVFSRAKTVNPAVRIIAEQGDWGYGDDFLTRGGADFVFAFPLRFAIDSFDAPAVRTALAETWRRTPAGKGQLLFLENHDTDRFASIVDDDPRKLRLGATLAILLKGTPLLYYGQEIGMRGRISQVRGNDGNDIPVREAMEWNRVTGGTGGTEWYRDTGPWWTERFARDSDGVSVEEQHQDPASLLSHYRALLKLRRTRADLTGGDQRVIPTAQPGVLAVVRTRENSASLLIANLSASGITVSLPVDSLPQSLQSPTGDLLTGSAGSTPLTDLRLAPYEARLLVP